MSNKVDKKITIWKKKLLDMGLRNRLLNFKETKRTTIEITAPDYKRLYKLLVQDEKKLSFSRVVMNTESLDDHADDYPEEKRKVNRELAKRDMEVPGDLETNHTAQETHQIVKNIRDKAKLAKEEQGVNILYLSFGFVEWKESEKDKENNIMSPLVLVPVILTSNSITDPYRLSLHEDEIVVNPTLSYKFETEFGIMLPAFDAQNDDIEQYLETVKKSLSGTGFKVNTRTILSFLSFLKINMYKDLEQHSETIGKNEIIQTLAGENVEHSGDCYGISNYDHDKMDQPELVYQVVDADSSQQDAITMSKRGTSFVLQGPPGTGKSQTITNIIAEALANGKKVLFVSEKMAALEVVYKRLTSVGLADFCLVLHSNKVNKREFLDSLRKVIDLPSIAVRDSAIYKLKQLKEKRERLNNYCEELHKRIFPLDQSVYEANGIIAQYQTVPNVIFDFNKIDVKRITKEQFFNLKIAVSNYVMAKEKLSESPENNVWKDTTINHINHEIRHNMSAVMDDLVDAFSYYIGYIKGFEEEFKIDFNIPISELKNYADFFMFLSTSKGFSLNWLRVQDYKALIEYVKKTQEKQEREIELESGLHAKLPDSFFEGRAEEKLDRIDEVLFELKRVLTGRFAETDYIIDNSDSLLETVREAENIILKEEEVLDSCLRFFQIDRIDKQKDIERLCEILGSYGTDFKLNQFWFTPQWQNNTDKFVKLKEAATLVQAIKDAREEVLSAYEKEILDLDYRSMLTRFKTDYTSFFKLFNRNYKNDCNAIRGCRKIAIKKITDEEALDILEKIKKYHETVALFSQKESEFSKYFGGWFDGENTDFIQIQKSMITFQKLCEEFPRTIPYDVIEELCAEKNIEKYKSEKQILEDCHNNAALRNLSGMSERLSFDEQVGAIHNTLSKLDDLLSKLSWYELEESCFSDDNFTKVQVYYALHMVKELENLQAEDVLEDAHRKEVFSSYYDGLNTDYKKIEEKLSWLACLKKRPEFSLLSVEIQKRLATDSGFASEAGELGRFLTDFYCRNILKIRAYESWFNGGNKLENSNCTTFLDKVKKCDDNLHGLVNAPSLVPLSAKQSSFAP